MILKSNKTHIKEMVADYANTIYAKPKDAMKILNISRSTLNRLVKDGTLPALRLSGANTKQNSRRFKMEDVLNILQKVIIN